MNDLLNTIADLIPCRKYGNYLTCNCLFHEEQNPSMFIYADSYRCLSCGAHGKTTKLLLMLEGKSVRPSKKALTPHLWRYMGEGVDIEDVAIEAHHRLKQSQDTGYYLKQRGIWSEFHRLMYGYLDGWFIFPVFDDQKAIIGLVARAGAIAEKNYNMRYMIPPGQKPQLYVPDWKMVKDAPYLCLTYGIIDAISLCIAGIPAISGTTGHVVPVELFAKLRKKIYIIPDGDGKDWEVSAKLATELSWRGKILTLDYPEGTKDCNDVYIRNGLESLSTLVNHTIACDNKYTFNIRKEK